MALRPAAPMTRSKASWLVTLLLVGAAHGSPAKDVIAVLDFTSSGVSAAQAVTISAFVRQAAVKADVYRVIDEKNMRKILSIQAIQQTGCTDQTCAVRLGKVLNAKKVIVGEYAVLDNARFLTAQLVDVETGHIERVAKAKRFAIADADEAADQLVAQLYGLSSTPPAVVSSPEARAVVLPSGRFPREITGSDGAPMILIPAGEFTMGSSDYYDDECPPHRVAITEFYMDKYEVTFDLYDKFCGETGRDKPPDEGWGRGSRPVIWVTWEDANAYAHYYSKALPTEAEWEYASRAGTTGAWHFGDDKGRLHEYAWCDKDFPAGRTHPVGEKKPNPWGLFDMYGNVDEWCADWYDRKYYVRSPFQDPPGPPSGEYRVERGGNFSYAPSECRSASRSTGQLKVRYCVTGFRCTKSVRP